MSLNPLLTRNYLGVLMPYNLGDSTNTIPSWGTLFMLPESVQNLFIQSGSGAIGVGNSGDNLLVAEGSSNYAFTLVGGTGNDVLIGNSSIGGDPQFDTGPGSTTYIIAK